MHYEDRIVCFIDILGFRELISKSVKKDGTENSKATDLLLEAFSRIETSLEIGEEPFTKSKMITQFSDCIVISFKYTERSGVFWTLIDIQHLLINLVYLGIICRGGITVGKLVHTDKVVFGPGLVDAYTLESKAANYPRIILGKEILKIASEYHAEHHNPKLELESVKSILGRDSDGMYYIDYFAAAQDELDDPEYDFPEYLQKLSEIVESNINSSKPDIKVKYSWLKMKYNKALKPIKQALEGQNDIDDELAEAYNSLSLFP